MSGDKRTASICATVMLLVTFALIELGIHQQLRRVAEAKSHGTALVEIDRNYVPSLRELAYAVNLPGTIPSLVVARGIVNIENQLGWNWPHASTTKLRTYSPYLVFFDMRDLCVVLGAWFWWYGATMFVLPRLSGKTHRAIGSLVRIVLALALCAIFIGGLRFTEIRPITGVFIAIWAITGGSFLYRREIFTYGVRKTGKAHQTNL